MIKREAYWQTVFNQYIKEKKWYGHFELKATEAKTFPFSKIEQVQWDSLQAMETGGLVWKYSDQDQRPKPCDMSSVPPLPCYLVIKFKDGFYIIRFSEILKLSEAGEKSISQEVARSVCDRIVCV